MFLRFPFRVGLTTLDSVQLAAAFQSTACSRHISIRLAQHPFLLSFYFGIRYRINRIGRIIIEESHPVDPVNPVPENMALFRIFCFFRGSQIEIFS